jgi:adenosylcobinamide kinase/adenosylcobinamide-phosphate guanylyltransferase
MNGFKSHSCRIILITGPARCGKSEWAEHLAQQHQQVFYLATALVSAEDVEWTERIRQHRQRRPKNWETWEIPVDLPKKISDAQAPGCLLIDSLGTWVANLLEENDLTWQQTQKELLQSLLKSPLDIILVAEETGWGVVPAYPLGRKFRDRLGTLVREVAQIASTVYLVTAGHVLNLTELGTPLLSNE